MERKFVVAQLPDAVRDGHAVGTAIRQGYLAEEAGVEVRIRITADQAVLTVKAGTGLSRTEVECRLAMADAEALWPSTAGRRIDKVRHRLPMGAQTAEIDVYAGELSGLVVVEVEFVSTDAAAGFAPPQWFGEELTGRTGWSNAALARHGRPH